MRKNVERDQRIVQEMWTQANLEPLTLAPLQRYGLIDRERYRRLVDTVVLELTLDRDPRSNHWSYELAILDPEGGSVEDDVVEHWLTLFFGRDARFAAKRSFLLTGEARFTLPYDRPR